jgi:hypothetical protein
MRPSIVTSLLAKLRLRESWIIFFILGLVMLNYPFIHIFSKTTTIMDIPVLYHYLQLGWLASILVVLVFRKAIDIVDQNIESGKGE